MEHQNNHLNCLEGNWKLDENGKIVLCNGDSVADCLITVEPRYLRNEEYFFAVYGLPSVNKVEFLKVYHKALEFHGIDKNKVKFLNMYTN